jgi:hypothetical protein
VVLVVGRRRGPATQALHSILAQPDVDRLEVLLVDCAGVGADPLPGADHPSVRRLALPSRTTFGEARAAAVHQARTPIVAFLEEHCIALPGWSEAIARAHAGPWAGVGGEIYSANPGVGLSDAVYLLGYGAWSPPADRGPAAHIPAHDSSYSREILLQAGEALPRLLTSEPLLQEWLISRGHQLFVEPDVRFLHLNETKLDSLKGFFWWNRVFSANRAELQAWSKRRRLAYGALGPALVALRTLRQARMVLRRTPRRWWSLTSNLPLIVLVNLVAVAGNIAGVAFGASDAEARFTNHELNSSEAR